MAKEAVDTLKVEDFEQYQIPDAPEGGDAPITQTPNGLVLSNGAFASPNYVKGRSGWKLDSDGNFEAVNGTFSGTLEAISLNIPDSTTTNSYHVDSQGNSWWGATVAQGYASAPAYILNTGFAHFENVEIGGTTIQYVITNSGIFSFGDGSDGDATIGSDTTLTADKYYNNLTISSGFTLNPGGFRIFVKNTLTLNGTGKIARNGTVGSSLADGYLKGAPSPGGGGSPGTSGAPNGGAGGTGASPTNSIGTSNGTNGQAGGNSAAGTGGSGGTGGTVTPSNVKLIANWHLATLLDIIQTDATPTGYKVGQTIKFTGNATSGGGGGGAGPGPSLNMSGGAGGAAGGNGGIVAVYARSIVIGASASITSNGSNGADGSNATWTEYPVGPGPYYLGNGGGGAGGNGGIVLLVYNSLVNSGSITCTGGSGGMGGGQKQARGTDSSPDVANTQASAGSSGAVYQFQLSL